MPFVIYEQGMRITTPTNRIFPPRTVDPVEQVAAKPAIDAEHTTRTDAAIAHYQQPDESRHVVQYAREIMTSPVTVMHPGQLIGQVWRIFRLARFRHIPVVDQIGNNPAALVGIVADRDIWPLALANQQFEQQTLAAVMQKRVISATPDTSIRVMAGAMAEQRIGSVPIVDDDGQVVGIVTRSDILRVLVNQAPLEIWI